MKKGFSYKQNWRLSTFVLILSTLLFLVGTHNVSAKSTDKVTKEYNAALSAYKTAVAKLHAAEKKTPAFYISGEITKRSKSELWIWGTAASDYASPSHPGWLISDGNIVIKNYDSRNISYNNYYGWNYYIKQTTGVGLFGQSVPVNIYGPAPSKIISLQKSVDAASRKLHEKKLKLPAQFSIQYKGSNVTDNQKKPIKLDQLPLNISLSNQSKGAESSSWYISTGKNKWKLVSNSTNAKVSITSDKATIKLVINHNQKNYKIHTVYASLPATGFKDVAKTHWAAHSIIKVTKSGLMKDYKDGKFHPNNAVTKGEFAKLIVQAYKIKTISPATPSFADVSKNNSYYPYIEAAKYYFNGKFSTDKNEKFNPNAIIRRDEAAAVMARITLLDQQSISGESYLKARYKDYKTISPSLYKLVAIAINNDLILGYDNRTFKGSSSLDRANAAYLVNQTSEKYYSKYKDNVKFTYTLPDSTFNNNVTIYMKMRGNAKVYLENQIVKFDYYDEASKSFRLVNGEGTYIFNIRIVQPFSIKEINKKVIYKIPSPTLKINTLPANTDEQSINISGKVTDPSDDDPTIYINNQKVYVGYNGDWSKNIELSEGTNTFVIKAVNRSGKATTITKVINFKPAAPALIINAIPESTDLDSITISGKVTDKNDSHPTVYVNDEEVYVNVYDGGKWSKTIQLQEGTNTIKIKTVNSLGKQTTVTKKITFNPGNPVLTVNTIPESTDLDSITISGKVTDKNDDRPTVYVNDEEVYVNVYDSGKWSKTINLQEGTNTIKVEAVNSLGKQSLVTKKITFNPGNPVLTVNTIPESTDLDSITISGKVTDKNDSHPTVYVNDEEVYVNVYDSGKWSKTIKLQEGTNTIKVNAVNSLGKETTITKTITFNPGAPVLTINTIPASTSSSSITISGNVKDKNDRQPTVYVNGQEVYVSGYDGSWTKTFNLKVGENTFEIKAVNRLGKVTTETRTITYVK